MSSDSRANRQVQNRNKKKRHRLRTTLILLLVLALIVGGGYWAATSVLELKFNFGKSTVEDYPGPGSGSATVTIESGDLGTTIGKRLVDAGIVKSVEAFTQAFDSNSASHTIKPGTYTLKKQMTAAEALAGLLDETNRLDNALTINPGQTVADLKGKMEQITGFDSAAVSAVFDNPTDVGLPDVAGGKLEGWLWAGSYEVSPGETPAAVVKEMVGKTVEFLKTTGQDESKWEEILTKASIVEREVNWHEHMPKVARVVENRLADVGGETNGRLQMDSTVNYGVGKSGGMPGQSDIDNDNPYNTYLHAGLPPAPIATPSEDAIKAVLNPADGNWLYFVTVNLQTGETLFTDSFDQLKVDIQKLNDWCTTNPGQC